MWLRDPEATTVGRVPVKVGKRENLFLEFSDIGDIYSSISLLTTLSPHSRASQTVSGSTDTLVT